MSAETITVVETRDVGREYGYAGTDAILDHPKHGHILICDGFGGQDSLSGGMVRWRHGLCVRLLPGDTLDSLEDVINDYGTTVGGAALRGYDRERPVLDISGIEVDRIARAAGL